MNTDTSLTLYNHLEVVYKDGHKTNIVLLVPFQFSVDMMGRMTTEEWIVVESETGLYIICKDEVRKLRFNNDWIE